jgi:hypothetical protein
MDRGILTKSLTYIQQANPSWKEKPFSKIQHAYTNVVRELIECPGREKVEHTIVVESVFHEGEETVDVYLVDEGNSRISLDFTDWNDLIDLPVKDKISKEVTQMLGHVLYEITWWGFTNESIRQQGQELLDNQDRDNIIPFDINSL